MRAVIGLLHADMHQRGTVGSVCHLATSVITVAPGIRGDEAVARITKRSKSGKVMQDVSNSSFWMTILCSYTISKNIDNLFLLFCPQEEVFSIKEDLKVIVQGKPSQLGPKQTDPEEQEVQNNTFLPYADK